MVNLLSFIIASLSILPVAIDTTCHPGTIPYQQGVSASGGLTVDVPVMTAPVHAGAPQISISYNSQSGNGVAGYGWNVGGVSAISLVPESIYYDGAVLDVEPDPGYRWEAFALDGMRLVQNDDTAFPDYQYVTVQGDIYVMKVASGTYISHFVVLRPDGSVDEYGFRDPLRGQHVFPITKHRDKEGYETRYTYLDNGGINYLTSVSYGSQTSSVAPGEILLTYVTLTDASVQYKGGESFTEGKRLSSIESYSGQYLLRRYDLSYNYIKGISFLSSISCTNNDGDSLNPLRFNYGHSSQAFFGDPVIATLPATIPDSQKPVFLRGHFLHSSHEDGMAIIPTVYSTYGMISNGVYGSPYPSNINLPFYPTLEDIQSPASILTGSGFQTLSPADVDGDGVDELVRVNFSGSSCYASLFITTYKAENVSQYNSSFFFTYLNGIIQEEDNYASPMPRIYRFGDFDGDGKTELLTVSLSSAACHNYERPSWWALIDLDTHEVVFDRTFIDIPHTSADKLRVIDIDGDGRSEIIFASNGSVYRVLRTGFVPQYDYSINPQWFGDDYLVGDVNGDRLPDFVKKAPLSPLYERHTECWAPGGCRFCACEDPIAEYGNHCCRVCNGDLYHYYHTHPQDARCWSCGEPLIWTGDPSTGETILRCAEHGMDIVTYYHEEMGKTWTFHMNTGTGFVSRTKNVCNYYGGDKFQLWDMDKDGKSDLVMIRDYDMTAYTGLDESTPSVITNVISFPYIGPSALPRKELDLSGPSAIAIMKDNALRLYPVKAVENQLLTRLIDSFGNIYDWSFRSAYDRSREENPEGGFYQCCFEQYRDSAVVFPYSRPSPALVLLYSMKHFSNTGLKVGDLRYLYRGLTVHQTGKGWCGFNSIVSLDILSDRQELSSFDPLMGGVPIGGYSPDGESRMTWIDITRPNHSEIIMLSSSETTDATTGVTTLSSISYDGYGFPVRAFSQSTTAGGTPGPVSISKTSYSHRRSQACYQAGLVNETISLSGDEFSGWSLLRNSFTIDTTGRVTGQDSYTGMTIDTLVTTGIPLSRLQLTYDSFGNIVSSRSSDHGRASFLETTRTFSSDGRFMLSETDPSGRTATQSQFNAYGSPSITTDQRGKLTTYIFNSWGEIVGVNRPDGSADTTTITWGGRGIFKVSVKGSGHPESILNMDSFGRVIRSSERRFDGSLLHRDTEYNENGQVYRVSFPFKGTAATKWTSSYYDSHKRKYQESIFGGPVFTWQYDTTSVTTRRNGVIQSVKTTDASGRLVRALDHGGVISYTYRPDGQPLSITSPGGAVTAFCYDPYGDRSRIVDPAAGVQTDTTIYNADGTNTHIHTTGNGTITSYYDIYGRLTRTERSNSFSTDYTYNAYGELVLEQSNNGTSRGWQYDTLGRVTREWETASGITLGRTYSYNADGTLASTDYDKGSINSTFATELYTYSYGHKVKTSLSTGQTVYEKLSENSQGMLSSAKCGNITRSYGFSDFGLPEWRTAGNTNVQSLWYDFDVKTGNLNWRVDDRDEYFCEFGTYDAMDRLINVAYWVDGPDYGDDFDINHNTSGSVSSIEGVGTMAHADQDHVHRITQFTASSDNHLPDEELTIEYTSFGRPSHISRGEFDAYFTYNASHERVKMLLFDADGLSQTRYYLGGQYESIVYEDYETERLYLGGDYYDSPMVMTKDTEEPSWSYLQLFRDYLGSITSITDYSGTVLAGYSYDAWGRMRNPYDLEAGPYDADHQPDLLIGRGYTGHEHLPWFGLINMNARLYDPVTARFLSPDPYVQLPDNTQNFNRYAYALNNPLRYTDQSGEWIGWDDLAAVIIGGGVNWIANGCKRGEQGWMFFSIGVATGLALLYVPEAVIPLCAVAEGLNCIVDQGYDESGKWNIENIDPNKVLYSSMIGGFTASIGVAVSSMMSPLIAKWTTDVANPILRDVFSGMVNGFVSGALCGFGIGLFSNNISFQLALNMAVIGGLSGCAMGAVSGYGEGIKEKLFNKKNRYQGVEDASTNSGKENYSVIIGKDAEGNIKYVGTTTQPLDVRAKQLNTLYSDRPNLHYDIIYTNSSKQEANILKQMYINEYGLTNLYNQRNAIAPKYWEQIPY